MSELKVKGRIEDSLIGQITTHRREDKPTPREAITQYGLPFRKLSPGGTTRRYQITSAPPFFARASTSGSGFHFRLGVGSVVHLAVACVLSGLFAEWAVC